MAVDYFCEIISWKRKKLCEALSVSLLSTFFFSFLISILVECFLTYFFILKALIMHIWAFLSLYVEHVYAVNSFLENTWKNKIIYIRNKWMNGTHTSGICVGVYLSFYFFFHSFFLTKSFIFSQTIFISLISSWVYYNEWIIERKRNW